MDFQPIERADTPPDSQNMEVLLAVAQQDMVDRHVEMLLAAGLRPVAIDVEPLAVSRALVELGPDPYGQRTVALINIGASNTDIGIFKDGILAFPRTLPLAGDTLTRAIATHMGVPEEQAEELKLQYGEVFLDQLAQPQQPPQDAFLDFGAAEEAPAEGRPMPFDFTDPNEPPFAMAPAEQDQGSFVPGDEPPAAAPAFDMGEEEAPPPALHAEEPAPQPVSNVPATVGQHDPTAVQVFTAMAPVLGEMLTELRRSLEYYRGRSIDGRIDEILLCGGTSRLRNLDQFLATELGVPTRVADPFQFTTIGARNLTPEFLHEAGPAFAVAIGLAARDMVAVPVPAGAKRGKK